MTSDLRFMNILGSIAFKLHDTYGFPIDLTQLMAEERGITVDMKAFEECKDKARTKVFKKSEPRTPTEPPKKEEKGP